MNRVLPIPKLGLFFVFAAIILCLGCKREKRDVVPYVFISLSLDLVNEMVQLGVSETATIIPDNNGNGILRFSNPDYPTFTLGPSQIINGNGIVIYRAGLYDYLAYDLTCTYRAQTDYCRLERSTTFDGLYECPCCDSQFLVNSGAYAFKGPAAAPLREYRTIINGTRLIINN
jgi:hypothetical protein